MQTKGTSLVNFREYISKSFQVWYPCGLIVYWCQVIRAPYIRSFCCFPILTTSPPNLCWWRSQLCILVLDSLFLCFSVSFFCFVSLSPFLNKCLSICLHWLLLVAQEHLWYISGMEREKEIPKTPYSSKEETLWNGTKACIWWTKIWGQI